MTGNAEHSVFFTAPLDQGKNSGDGRGGEGWTGGGTGSMLETWSWSNFHP